MGIKDLRRGKEHIIDVKRCARCGQNHDGLQFHLFTNPSGEYTHWAMCPNTNEPILLLFELTKNK